MKTRSLIILALITAASTAGAVGSVYYRQQLVQSAPVPASLFPGLLDQVNRIESLTVQTPSEKFTIVKAENGWEIPEKGGYPVRFETVKQAAVGMASLAPITRKTARAELYHKLELDDPANGGTGTRITLNGPGGEVVAGAVLGRIKSQATETRTGWRYVRAEGAAQSWLARSRLETWEEAASWADSSMPTIDRARIHGARSTDAASGESVYVVRENPGVEDFAMQDIPAGRRIMHPTSGNALGSSLGFLSFEDLGPAGDFDFEAADHITEFDTFDGLVVRIALKEDKGGVWARFTFRYDPEMRIVDGFGEEEKKAAKTTEAVQAEAKQLQARFSPWAYRFGDYKVRDWRTGLVELTVPDKKASQN